MSHQIRPLPFHSYTQIKLLKQAKGHILSGVLRSPLSAGEKE